MRILSRAAIFFGNYMLHGYRRMHGAMLFSRHAPHFWHMLSVSRKSLVSNNVSTVRFWRLLRHNRRLMHQASYRASIMHKRYLVKTAPETEAIFQENKPIIVAATHHGALHIDELLPEIFPPGGMGVTVGNYRKHESIYPLNKQSAPVSLAALYEKLKQGKCVLFMFDAAFGQRPLSVTMFGHTIKISESMFELSRLLMVPIVPLTSYREGDQPAFYIHAPLVSPSHFSKNNQALADTLAAFFEHDLKTRNPLQLNYVWFEERLRQDKLHRVSLH